MKSMMPLGPRAIVRPLPGSNVRESGLVMVGDEKAREPILRGVVVAVGWRNHGGEQMPLEVMVADVVRYEGWHGTNVEVEGKHYLIMDETAIVGVELEDAEVDGVEVGHEHALV